MKEHNNHRRGESLNFNLPGPVYKKGAHIRNNSVSENLKFSDIKEQDSVLHVKRLEALLLKSKKKPKGNSISKTNFLSIEGNDIIDELGEETYYKEEFAGAKLLDLNNKDYSSEDFENDPVAKAKIEQYTILDKSSDEYSNEEADVEEALNDSDSFATNSSDNKSPFNFYHRVSEYESSIYQNDPESSNVNRTTQASNRSEADCTSINTEYKCYSDAGTDAELLNTGNRKDKYDFYLNATNTSSHESLNSIGINISVDENISTKNLNSESESFNKVSDKTEECPFSDVHVVDAPSEILMTPSFSDNGAEGDSVVSNDLEEIEYDESDNLLVEFSAEDRCFDVDEPSLKTGWFYRLLICGCFYDLRT